MGRPRDERDRVIGPTHVQSRQALGWKSWRVVVVSPKEARPDRRRVTKWFATEADAQEVCGKVDRGFKTRNATTVGQAIDQFRDFLMVKGTGEISYKETRRRLLMFFPSHDVLVSRVTPERAEDLYVKFREGRSVAYHRAALINARSFFKWAMKAGLVGANPFAAVEGVGKRNRGKLQWTGDEARRAWTYALPLAEAGDKNALACLMSLLMGLRSADICKRVVRDVDLEGSVLRVSEGKTDKSDRVRHVPEVLRPMLVKLAAGRDPFEPLFARRKKGALLHHTRRWLEQALDKMCTAAGAPRIVPHALKGVSGSVLAVTGELSERIADHLSHEDSSTTEQHYVAKGAIADARTARGMRVITGGKR